MPKERTDSFLPSAVSAANTRNSSLDLIREKRNGDVESLSRPLRISRQNRSLFPVAMPQIPDAMSHRVASRQIPPSPQQNRTRFYYGARRESWKNSYFRRRHSSKRRRVSLETKALRSIYKFWMRQCGNAAMRVFWTRFPLRLNDRSVGKRMVRQRCVILMYRGNIWHFGPTRVFSFFDDPVKFVDEA